MKHAEIISGIRTYLVPILMNLDNWANHFPNRNSYFLCYQKSLMKVGSCSTSREYAGA